MSISKVEDFLEEKFNKVTIYDGSRSSYNVGGFSVSASDAERIYSGHLNIDDVICQFGDSECSGQATPILKCTFCGAHKGNPCRFK